MPETQIPPGSAIPSDADAEFDALVLGGSIAVCRHLPLYRNGAGDRSEEFWAEAAEAIDWERRWDRLPDASRPPFYRWFPGGRPSTSWNALDCHVAAGRGDRAALIWDSPVTGQIKQFTYHELQGEFTSLGTPLPVSASSKSDRVLIYVPMVPESAIAMLACARIGAAECRCRLAAFMALAPCCRRVPRSGRRPGTSPRAG
jgi:hypothetical protein